MKWAHLPVQGGLYDQHPKLLARWQMIFAARNEKQRREQEQEQRKQGRNAPRGRPMAGRRR